MVKPGDGKPRSTKRKRTEGLYIALLPEEKQAVEARAASVGMDPTSYGRHRILRDAPISSQRERKVLAGTLLKLNYELSKIGTNINQLAHEANAGRFPAVQRLEVELAEFASLRKRVRAEIDGLGDDE